MRYPRIIMAQALFFAVAMTSAAFAADVPCSQCGMIVDAGSKFAAKIVAGDTLFFCDIGDLFVYLKRKKMSADGAFVKDHPSGEWVEAKAAYFVHDEKRFKTPMGWGVAAYRDRNRAAEAGKAMDFDAAAKAMQ